MSYVAGPIIDITNGLPVDLAEQQCQGQAQYWAANFDKPALDLGMELLEAGYRVIPIRMDTKHPYTTNWQRRAAWNGERLEALWAEALKYCGPDVEVRPGVVLQPGFLVVDIDHHGPGSEAFNFMLANGLTFPPGADTAMACHTPRRGLHVYLGDPNRKARTCPSDHPYPGIEILAEGRFSVAYPNLYVMPVEDLAPAPMWCYPPRPARTKPGTQNTASSGQAVAVGAGKRIPNYSRNCTLFYDYAWPMAKNGADYGTVVAKLREVYRDLCDHDPPMEDAELRSIAKSATSGKLRTGKYDRELLEKCCNQALADEYWHYRGGKSDRRVYQALLDIVMEAYRTSGLEAASTRRLAEKANVSQKTASNCMNRLMAKGLVTVTKPGNMKKAPVYDLLRPKK